MAKTLAVNYELTVRFAYVKDDEVNSEAGSFIFALAAALTDGTEAMQADLLWADRRTLVAASETLDLAGVLADAYADVLTFVDIKGFIIYNRERAPGKNLLVGGAAANAFDDWVGHASDIVKVGPGGILPILNPRDGYTVTAGTNDQLKIDAGARTITYDIMIFGTSAAGS